MRKQKAHPPELYWKADQRDALAKIIEGHLGGLPITDYPAELSRLLGNLEAYERMVGAIRGGGVRLAAPLPETKA